MPCKKVTGLNTEISDFHFVFAFIEFWPTTEGQLGRSYSLFIFYGILFFAFTDLEFEDSTQRSKLYRLRKAKRACAISCALEVTRRLLFFDHIDRRFHTFDCNYEFA